MQYVTKLKTRRVMAAVMLAIFAIAPAQAAETRFYGLYRAMVVANADPLNEGRLQVQVINAPAFNGMAIWALPVLREPYTTKNLKLPQIGQGVWIEFEQGDGAFPAWLGTFPLPHH